MSDRIDYAAVIAALESEKTQAIAEFDSAISAIRHLASRPVGTGVQQMPLPGSSEAPPASVQPYLDLSVAKASAAYLRAVGRPRSTGDIARALERGGLVNNSKSFTNTVYARLYRAGETFERQGDSWALREWSNQKKS